MQFDMTKEIIINKSSNILQNDVQKTFFHCENLQVVVRQSPRQLQCTVHSLILIFKIFAFRPPGHTVYNAAIQYTTRPIQKYKLYRTASCISNCDSSWQLSILSPFIYPLPYTSTPPPPTSPPPSTPDPSGASSLFNTILLLLLPLLDSSPFSLT